MMAMQTYLEKRQPTKNVARFCRMAVMPNLSIEWTLLYREWGRIGQLVFGRHACHNWSTTACGSPLVKQSHILRVTIRLPATRPALY